jgi:predicted nucleic acid-binding protein
MARRSIDTAYADANLFVALFAGPGHALHQRSLQVFRRVADGELRLILTPVVMAELSYVTAGLLGWRRQDAADRLIALLEADGILTTEPTVLARCLALFRDNRRLDFVDAYLAARAVEDGPASIATFDRALAGVDGIRVVAA